MFFASNSFAENNNTIMLPDVVSSKWHNTEKVGEAKFKKFGLHIYDASYWSLRNKDSAGNASSATALSIAYAKNIRARRLLSSTYKEWQRLGFAEEHPLDAWLELLEEIWPDVNKGDFIVFVNHSDGSNAFYSDSKFLGSVDDPEFGTAFLDIWLNINAKYKKHREELLGEND